MGLWDVFLGALATQAAIVLVLVVALRVLVLRSAKRRTHRTPGVSLRWRPDDSPDGERAETAAWLAGLLRRLAPAIALRCGPAARQWAEQAVASAHAGLAAELPGVELEPPAVRSVVVRDAVPELRRVRWRGGAALVVDAVWRGAGPVAECVVETGAVVRVLETRVAVLPVALHVCVASVRLRAVVEFGGAPAAPRVTAVVPRGRFAAVYSVCSAVGAHACVVDAARIEAAVRAAVRALLERHVLSPRRHVLWGG